MKALGILLISFIVSGALVLAHEGNEHVRGVVTELSPKSIVVQTTDKKTAILGVTAKTTFQLAGKPATLADLKIGDRVVIDVPEKSSDALLVQIGTSPAVAKVANPSRAGRKRRDVLMGAPGEATSIFLRITSKSEACSLAGAAPWRPCDWRVEASCLGLFHRRRAGIAHCRPAILHYSPGAETPLNPCPSAAFSLSSPASPPLPSPVAIPFGRSIRSRRWKRSILPNLSLPRGRTRWCRW